MLLTVKKDSESGKVKIKLVCDSQALNAKTVPDTGSLGNMEELLIYDNSTIQRMRRRRGPEQEAGTVPV